MKKLKRFLVIATAILTFAACQKQTILIEEATDSVSDMPLVALNTNSNNPYSVENMRKAYSNLALSEDSDIIKNINEEIKATHLYIQFVPKSQDELSVLDTSIILYKYPMDNEVLDEAQVRKIDAAIEKGIIVPRYASVAVSQIIPESVNYNVLAELFIPDDYSDEHNIRKAAANPAVSSLRTQGIVEKLVDEAFLITGHDVKQGEIGIQASSWRPSGKIRVWDKNKYDWVGTEGVKVKANRWFTTHTGFVLSNGTFSCNGTFKRPANYSFNWDRNDFEIWGGTSISSVGINGPKIKGPWNLDIQGGVQEFYGTIFRAAFHYYYQNNLGLRRPPQNSFWKTKLKLGAVYEANSDINGNFAFWRGFANLGTVIKIYNPQRNTRDIYGTVIHEIAHASHWNFSPVRKDFTSADLNVAESFARGVQWALTRLVYPGYVPQYTRKSYTGMVQDLVDGTKRVESDYYYEGNTTVSLYKEYQDRISGYTLRQIEDQLVGTRTWDTWQNKLISAYTNPTEIYIFDTFNYWNQM